MLQAPRLALCVRDVLSFAVGILEELGSTLRFDVSLLHLYAYRGYVGEWNPTSQPFRAVNSQTNIRIFERLPALAAVSVLSFFGANLKQKPI